MFKTAANIYLIYSELPFEERFAQAKRDGFDAVEFYDGWEDKDIPRVKELLKENGLELSTMSGDTPPGELLSMCDPAQKERYISYVTEAIQVAKELGCKTLMIHAAAISSEPPYEATPLTRNYSATTKICAMFDCLKTLAPIAEEAGVTLALEAISEATHSGYFLQDTKTSVDITQAVNSPNIKILFDAYHMALQGESLCEQLINYHPAIGHIHLGDAPGGHEPGTGKVDYKNLLQHLASLPYDRYISFELSPIYTSQKAVTAIQELLSSLDR